MWAEVTKLGEGEVSFGATDTALLLLLRPHGFCCRSGLDQIATDAVRKAGAGFPGARGGRAGAGTGRGRDWVFHPQAELIFPLGRLLGTDTKLQHVALEGSCAPTFLQSKCLPLHEEEEEREGEGGMA